MYYQSNRRFTMNIININSSINISSNAISTVTGAVHKLRGNENHVNTFYNNRTTLAYVILLLHLRIYNESLYISILNKLSDKDDEIKNAIVIMEDEYNNWENRKGVTNEIELKKSLFYTLNKIYFSEDEESDKKDNASEWNDFLKSNSLLSDYSTFWHNELNKSILAELFYKYLDILPFLREDENYSIDDIISKIESFDIGLFLELFKLTIMFDIYNEFSDDYIRIGKLAYQSEKREYEKNNS